MDPEEIRREVERLSPWYYQFDLKGVRTDGTAPCDHSGHRRVAMPAVREGFWQGRTVLDVGCAEGALSFGALDRGAAEVLAVDCRETHVEKGRFVARVLGQDKIRFAVGAADRWPEEHTGQRFDVVIFCGLIYHLREPWDTVAHYCRIAQDAVLVTSVLWGGADGWSWWKELDTIGASEGVLDSLMPNTVGTIIAEFGKHGFVPTHVYETGNHDWAAGCAVLFERSADFPVRCLQTTGTGPDLLDIHVARPKGELTITLYNRSPQAFRGTGTLLVTDQNGAEVLRKGPEALALPARRTETKDDLCTSVDFREPLGGAAAGRLLATVRVTDHAGAVVRESRYLVNE